MVSGDNILNTSEDDIPVSVNPNPAKEFVVINTEVGNLISIMDSAKSLVYCTTVTDSDTKIYLLNFDSGIYSLIIKNPGGAKVVKVLKI